MPVTFTTTLPDEDQPLLGNGVEDEVAVDRESAPTNYGDVRLQIRETGAASWGSSATGFAEQTIAYDTLTAQFTGREDGEEYEVRARTETEHATGAWTTPVSIVTKFPGASSLTIDALDAASAELSWQDNADNEAGFRLQHRRIYDDGPGNWTTVAVLLPDTTSVTDDELVPDESYEFRIVAFTDDTTAASNVVQGATSGIGLSRTAIPARGWYVEIDHPSGTTRRPAVRSGAQFVPTLNDLPEATLPVRRADHWLSQNWEGQPIRVWRDGERLPLDRVDAVTVEPDRVIITAIGGGELDTRVTQTYQQREAWLAVRDDLIPQTSYGAAVDDPGAGGTDTDVQSAATTAELSEQRKNPLPTDPVIVSDGALSLAQSCFTREAEDEDRGSGTFFSDPAFSRGGARAVAGSGESLEWDVTTAYTIPESAVGVAGLTIETDNAREMQLVLELDSGVSEVLDYLNGGEGLIRSWDQYGDGTYNSNGWTSGDIPPGTHTLKLEATGAAGDEFGFDVLALLYDRRFTYTFDTAVNADGYLAGPELYPDAFDVVFDDVATAFNVTGGAVSAALDNTGGQQALALSNDGGQSFTTTANTDSFATTFASGGSSLGLKLTLSRYGTRTDATPTTGYRSQTLANYTLTATLEESPVLINQRYDDSLLAILQQIADYGDFVFQVRWSESEGRQVIEFTQAGQRTADSDVALTDFSLSKQLGAAYEKAVIYGAAQTVEDEQFTATHGTPVALDNSILVEASESVRDPTTGTAFVRGSDYELDTEAGTITTLAGGAMTSDESYIVSYRYKVRGSYASPSAGSDPRTVVETLPSITSAQGCAIAALYLIRAVGSPLYEAELELPPGEVDLELVSAQTVNTLPGDEGLVVWEVQSGEDGATLRLGTRRRLREAISDLQARLQASAQRV